MRYPLTTLLLFGCIPLASCADSKKPADASNFKEIAEEYQNVMGEHNKAVQAAKRALEAANTDAERSAAQSKLAGLLAVNPGIKLAERLLAFADKNPKDPDAATALSLALSASEIPGARDQLGPKNKTATWGKVIQLLQDNWTDKPEIGSVLPALRNANDDGATKLLQTIVDKNTDRKVQARALRILINDRRQLVELAEEVKENPTTREDYEQFIGKAHVAKVLAALEKNKKEIDELTKRLHEKYADICPDLSIGKTVPEVITKDLDGKEVKLSALRGRVVVLDFWATWCGPCRAMIPHERELVKKLKDKPFTLVSISADDDKDELKEFLKKDPMPWTHWWNGPDDPLLEIWDIQYYPSIFVLDAKGVIRFKDVRDKELDEAVEKLLKETEGK